jgi:hypothetical protein
LDFLVNGVGSRLEIFVGLPISADVLQPIVARAQFPADLLEPSRLPKAQA